MLVAVHRVNLRRGFPGRAVERLLQEFPSMYWLSIFFAPSGQNNAGLTGQSDICLRVCQISSGGGILTRAGFEGSQLVLPSIDQSQRRPRHGRNLPENGKSLGPHAKRPNTVSWDCLQATVH